MKVVCVKIPPTFVTIKVKVGEIFDAYKLTNSGNWSGPVTIHMNNGYWCVTDRLGNVIPCDFERGKYFITLEEWRQKQLDKIL